MDLQQIIDAVSTLGTLGFALLAVYALLSERVVPKGRLDEKNEQIAEHRAEKKEALDLAREAIANNQRLADAVEARNRLEEARELRGTRPR
jgi:hypothetical protein